ncbi:MAG: iron ABC transporter permease [Actinomycetota bacterium]|nr:iron ABC transporter permease [Actinomycetota bacterium]
MITARSRGGAVRTVLLVVVAAAFAVPAGSLLVRALGDTSGTWAAITDSDVLGPLRRTVVLAVIVTTLATIVGMTMAWCCSRTDVPGRRALRLIAVLPLVIPSFVAAHALVSAFSPGGLLEQALGWSNLPDFRGLPGAVVVLTLLTYPYVYLPVLARLSALPPSLEESGRLLGLSPVGVFRRVVLAQIAPAVLSGALLVALYTVSDFGAVQFVGYDTLTRTIFAAQLDPVRSVAMSLVLAVLAIAITVSERTGRRRIPVTTTTANRRPVPVPLGGWRVPATIGCWGLVTIALAAPVAVMAWWVVRGRSAGARRSQVIDLREAGWSSAWIAVVAAVVTVAVVLPLAVAAVRHRGRAASVAGAVVTSGFALPGVVIALALVQMFVGTALYQGFAVLVASYVLHFGGQAFGPAAAAVGAVPTRFDEVARLLGASRWRRWWRIDLRLMLPGLAAAGGLVLMSVLKELPATLMLRPIGFDTLATRISATVEAALLVDAGELSLVLIAVSGVLTWLLVIRRLDRLS